MMSSRMHEQNANESEWEGAATARGDDIIGKSPVFIDSLTQAAIVASADTTVLLCGETGTGKDVFARFIHERSRRAGGPFVAVNAAALPEHLVESEFFGHERGAFTGASARRAGSFEIAHGGTIFLDEIGELPLEAQAKLLRALQDREITRLGATRPVRVDVRVIAATNRNLEDAIARKQFRADLYYRLSVFPILTPALRDRTDDIPLLAQYFLRHFASKAGKCVALSDDAVERLQAYAWPGNVRELQNVIERAVILTRETIIDPDALELQDGPGSQMSTDRSREEMAALSEPASAPPLPHHSPADANQPTFADAERAVILSALNATKWRISGADGAADRLGLKPTTLHAKMKKLGIRRPIPIWAAGSDRAFFSV